MKDNNIIQDAIDCLKRLHKENAELKAYKDVNEDFKKAWEELKTKVEDRDEYIASLLLSLFLMQGEIDRLNQTLDLARKGELVYINNPQIEALKAENERLKEEFKRLKESECKICKYFNIGDKYHQILQEIKEIANNYIKGCVDCSLIAEPYECEDCTDGGMAKLGKKIIDLITKAESEEV